MVNPEDQILHGLTVLTYALMDVPKNQSDAQLQVITALSNASSIWASPDETSDQLPLPAPAQTCQSIRFQKRILNQTRLQHTIPPPANSKGS